MTNVLNEMHNVSPYLERKGLIGDFFLLFHRMIGGEAEEVSLSCGMKRDGTEDRIV